MNYYELIKNGINELIKSGIENKIAKQDAEDLLLYILKLSKAELIKKYNENVNQIEQELYNKVIQERKIKKPLSYITHNAIFFGNNFFINESTLIPRVDSEIIVENAINYINNNLKIVKKMKNEKKIKILDACCGSGCLGISLVKILIKNFSNEIKLTLSDISSSAIQVAKINCEKLLPKQIIVKYLINDMLINGFGNEKYDIILCNPPYIETNTIEKLDDEVKNFEPHLALDGGNDGIKFYKAIARTLNRNFFQNSVAFFEIGYNQGEIVKQIFTNSNFIVKTKQDYGRKDRCIILSLV